MGFLSVSPVSPNITRYSSFLFVIFEFIYIHLYYNTILAFFFSGPFFIIAFYEPMKNCYEYVIRTKRQILFSLYGVTVGSFLWNIGEMIGADYEYNYLLPVIAFYIQITCSALLIIYEFRLGKGPLKLIINPCHMFLITFFFCISAQWIYPYARWYNWIFHIYAFLLTVESSIITTTHESFFAEFPKVIRFGTRDSRAPWKKKWRYL